MTHDLPHDALTRACTPRLAVLPTPVAARLLAYLVDLMTALPPDDRSVLVALVERGALESALLAWWVGRSPEIAQARTELAWRDELMWQALPFVPLPDRAWPEIP